MELKLVITPLHSVTTSSRAEALLEILCRFGIPKQALSDRGTLFTSALMKKLQRLLSVKGFRTTPYHSMCNGLCEWFNDTLKMMLQGMAAEQPKSGLLSLPHYCLLTVKHLSHRCSSLPFELVYAKPARGVLQALQELWDNEEPYPTVGSTYSYSMLLIWQNAYRRHARLPQKSWSRRRSFINHITTRRPSSDICKNVESVYFFRQQPTRRCWFSGKFPSSSQEDKLPQPYMRYCSDSRSTVYPSNLQV